MKNRTQRKLANAISLGFVVAGLAVVLWGWMADHFSGSSNGVASRRSERPEIDLFEADVGGLSSLLNKKLQGPLNPPETQVDKRIEAKTRVSSAPAKPTWPSISVDCIFLGPNSRLAVFSADSKSFTCGEGEEFLGVKVEGINRDQVNLTWRGETRAFKPVVAEVADEK